MSRIVDSRCVLAVRDLRAATRFYVDVLGFRRDFGDGSDGWSFLSRDSFKLMLGECSDAMPASELGDHSYVAYLVVEGVDRLHAEVSARGAEIISPPATEPWGMREFAVRTPDGHRIRFGEPVADREIVSARVLPAPRELVFRAFSDPAVLARWWGPEGFVNTFHEFDFRPGGAWRFAMHGPDGGEYRMEKEFVEIVRPERIVLRHLDPVHGFLMTMSFADAAGGTLVTWRMRFDSGEEAERVRGAVVEANEENLDRLAAVLATIA